MSLIIVLNGTSSSGKSTLAVGLQEASDRTLLKFSMDTILYALPARELTRLVNGDEPSRVTYDALVAAYFSCVREMAAAGLSLIVECAITARRRAEQLVEALAGHDVVMVGLECAVDLLERREASRGDRRPGLARAQCDAIHRWLEYDVLVNTADEPFDRNVAAILRVVASSERKGIVETMARLAAQD